MEIPVEATAALIPKKARNASKWSGRLNLLSDDRERLTEATTVTAPSKSIDGDPGSQVK